MDEKEIYIEVITQQRNNALDAFAKMAAKAEFYGRRVKELEQQLPNPVDVGEKV